MDLTLSNKEGVSDSCGAVEWPEHAPAALPFQWAGILVAPLAGTGALT
jgi:hypothetical protein